MPIRPEAAKRCAAQILPEKERTPEMINLAASLIQIAVARDERDAEPDKPTSLFAAAERVKEGQS